MNYTTNGVGVMSARLQRVPDERSAFPPPKAVRKVLDHAIMKSTQRSTEPVHDRPAWLALAFPDRVPT